MSGIEECLRFFPTVVEYLLEHNTEELHSFWKNNTEICIEYLGVYLRLVLAFITQLFRCVGSPSVEITLSSLHFDQILSVVLTLFTKSNRHHDGYLRYCGANYHRCGTDFPRIPGYHYRYIGRACGRISIKTIANSTSTKESSY